MLGALICIAMIENILLLPLLYYKDAYKQNQKGRKSKFDSNMGYFPAKQVIKTCKSKKNH